MGSDWPSVELRKVLQIDLDKVQIDPNATYDMVGVLSFGKGLFHREPVSGNNTSYRYFYRLKKDHLVMSQLFGWEGAIALSAREFAGKFLSLQFPTFMCNQEVLDRRYLGWFVRRPVFWEELGKRAKGMGDRRKTLSPESLLSCYIPLPPVSEQRRVVGKIDELAAKIQSAQNLREEAAKETDALVNNQLRAAFSSLANQHGTISIGDLIIEASYGSSEKCDSERIEGAVPVLRIPNVVSEQITLADLKYARLSPRDWERLTLAKGDILVVRTNGSLDLVGRSAVVDELPEPMAFASYMIRFRLDQERIFPAYAQRALRYFRMWGQLVDLARTTAGQYNVSLGRLRSARMPVPPLSVQRRIVEKVDALQGEVNSLKHLQAENAAELDALVPSILDKAFKGEL